MISNFIINSMASFSPYLVPDLASCFSTKQGNERGIQRVVTTTTNSNERPFCDGYDIAGNRNAISRAIYASVMLNTNGIWIYPVRCMVVNYTGVGCAEGQGNVANGVVILSVIIFSVFICYLLIHLETSQSHRSMNPYFTIH